MTTDRFGLRGEASDPFASLCSPEAEQALLGALMLNNQAYEHVCDVVAAEDFTHAAHGKLYAAIGNLIGSGMRADAVTLRETAERDESLAGIGGVKYLAQLVGAVVTILGAPSYARTIADLARRREIVIAAQDIMADAAEATTDRDASAVVDEAEQRLYDIAERGSRHGAPRSLGDILETTVTDIENAYRRGGAITIDTGLADLDRIVSGLSPGDLAVLAGRPSMGKSACAGSIAFNVARQDKRALIFSLEMSRSELAQRWIAGTTGINTDRQRHGKLDVLDWQALADAKQSLATLPIFVDDQPRLSVAQMRQRARRVKRRHGLDLIVIDHLQLVRQGGKQESRRLEIGDATSSLKAIAKELQVPVLLLSQLSRAVEGRDDKRPALSDLKESGDIEQDADVVMFLYREAYYLERAEPKRKSHQSVDAFTAARADWQDQMDAATGLAEIIVSKNRHGRTGVAKVAFDGERQRFDNLAYQHGR